MVTTITAAPVPSVRGRRHSVLRDRDGIGLPCPVWPFLPWEGLEGGPLVCLGGVQVEEGPAVVRAARGIAQIGV
jgi:hypothetical protein